MKKRQEIEKNVSFHKKNIENMTKTFSFQKVTTKQLKKEPTENSNLEDELKQKVENCLIKEMSKKEMFKGATTTEKGTRFKSKKSELSPSNQNTIQNNLEQKNSCFVEEYEEIKDEMNQNKELSNRELNEQEQEKIKEIFRKLFIFDSVPDYLLNLVLDNLVLLHIPKGKYLYLKKSQNSFFYIIIKGSFQKNIDNKNNDIKAPKIFKEWEYIGEDSLMSNNKINTVDHSLLSLTDSEVLVLDSEKFVEIKDIIINLNLKDIYDFLNNIIIFKNLDSIIKHNIAKKNTTKTL